MNDDDILLNEENWRALVAANKCLSDMGLRATPDEMAKYFRWLAARAASLSQEQLNSILRPLRES